MGIKVSKRDIRKLDKDIKKAIDNSMQKTYIFFRRITPIDLGNARRNTDYNARTLTITGNYPYAERLDTGWSKQFGGKGMTKPSLVFLEKQLNSEFAKI